ncbi:hypothetical protein [Agrobacterium larrymoorei]|uniref:Uncharacterized protein n=1 Tax=Agrobacterium larrymoorei TaxID=160699 RepID=A0A4D7DPE7_9HYPH|nr:hypothetical protein [Agrobacterium larrymoorei]QCI98088.1 hypothetical protein CFBP5473_09320 [Agrobacterium larrymoorei]QYA06461.1 hypothetical protein J5285_10395 [Agrobacterium larrymoorei]
MKHEAGALSTKSKRKVSTSEQHRIDPVAAELSRLGRELDKIELQLNNSAKTSRTPGRFKGQLKVGASFFEPLTEAELKECSAIDEKITSLGILTRW